MSNDKNTQPINEPPEDWSEFAKWRNGVIPDKTTESDLYHYWQTNVATAKPINEQEEPWMVKHMAKIKERLAAKGNPPEFHALCVEALQHLQRQPFKSSVEYFLEKGSINGSFYSALEDLRDFVLAAQSSVREAGKPVTVSMRDFMELAFEEFHHNRPLYKDSGRWQMRSDDMKEVLVQQGVNESMMDFINRCTEDYGTNKKGK